jgi:metal-dependent HD superfamily phosphatase/phosphodiesterase
VITLVILMTIVLLMVGNIIHKKEHSYESLSDSDGDRISNELK